MKTSKDIEAYIYIVKYRGDEEYYVDITGIDDEIISMAAAAIIEDQRLTDAIEVAERYWEDYGGRNKN